MMYEVRPVADGIFIAAASHKGKLTADHALELASRLRKESCKFLFSKSHQSTCTMHLVYA